MENQENQENQETQEKKTLRCNRANSIINNFANVLLKLSVDCPEFSNAIDIIRDCQSNNGKVITTGLGKAGIVMRKFSATLCSLGVPSCYLHPGEANHGDLGVISSNDILFVASTSGKTREVIEVIDLAKNIGIKDVIGITSHVDSPIREKVSVVLNMGEIKEEGHLGLAPTTSIIVMLVITDCLSLVIAEENNFTANDYLKRHHSGYLASKAKEMI